MDLAQRLRFVPSVAITAILAVALAACGSPAPDAPSAPTQAAEDAPPTAAAAAPTATPPQATATELSATTPASADGTRLVLADSGNEAKYMVREQLAELSFPSDAVGTTTEISGTIAVSPDGSFIPEESSITVDLAAIRSDQDRRDNYVRQRVLETARYPTVVFVPTEARGLDTGALASGGATFELVGDLTLHGVTKQVVWNVTATLDADTLSGTATTEFPFEDFGMTVPSVMVVLSVDDNIRLQYDFNLVIESD